MLFKPGLFFLTCEGVYVIFTVKVQKNDYAA